MDHGDLPRASDSMSNSMDDIPSSGGVVVSEKVQYFANAIYGQLEKLVKKYDEDAVKELMPHVISLLESMDQMANEKRQLEVDIELVKEDNSQLLAQYEREKTMRRSIEQKCLEIEDAAEEEQQGLTEKIASMESIVRMLELKSKNSADHVARLEEKESEMKKDYQKLYAKYQELMRSHIDIMERRAYNEQSSDSSLPVPFDQSMLHRNSTDDIDGKANKSNNAENSTPIRSVASDQQQVGLHDFNANRNRAFSRGGQTVVSFMGGGRGEEDEDEENDRNEHTSHQLRPNIVSNVRSGDFESSHFASFTNTADDSKDQPPIASRFEEELSFQEDDFQSTPARARRGRKTTGGEDQDSSDEDVEGEQEDTLGSTPLGLSLGVSDFNATGRQSTFSVGREFDKLLRENAELLETKNALNVVKDDLIFQVDGLNNELRIFRERIASLEEIREHLQSKVSYLEDEHRRVKDELEETKHRLSNASGSSGAADEETLGQDTASTGAADGSTTQRRRFTRMEMARVLMERNLYKERLIELQETVRWVESLRASREIPENSQADLRNQKKQSSSIWNFFGGLFGAPSAKPKPLASPSNLPPPPPMPAGLLDANLGVGRLPTVSGSVDFSDRQKSRSFIAQSSGAQGRVEAYGWSIPASSCLPQGQAGMARSRAATRVPGAPTLVVAKPEVPIPIPVCCQPLPGSLNGMKIWSAAVAFSSVGFHPDGSRLFERSVFYGSPRSGSVLANKTAETPIPHDGQMPVSQDVAELEEEVSLEQHRVRASRGQLAELSSIAWLTCSSNNVNTHVFLVDMRQPSVLLAGFTLDAPYVSQVCAVPGAKPTDIVWQPLSSEALPISSISRSSSKTDQDLHHDDDCVELSRDVDKSNCSGWTLAIQDKVKTKVILAQKSKQTEETSAEGPQIDNTKSLLMPTMWFGAQDGSLFIYSASSAVQPVLDDSPQQLPSLFSRIQLQSAATAIAHVAGRVFVALSTSEIAIFHRNPETKEWVTDECGIIEFKRDMTISSTTNSNTPTPNPDNPLQQLHPPNSDDQQQRNASPSVGSNNSASSAIPAARCLVAVANRYLWVGVGREVLVIEPGSLRIESSFVCHPRQDAQLRHACSVGDGVWLAVRIDSVLRLFHAFTHQHLQDLDLQPAIHSFIFGDTIPAPGTATSALSPLRVSAMVAGGGRLWIGTHTGLVVSVPFASSEQQFSVKAGPGNNQQLHDKNSPVTKQPGSSASPSAGPGTIVQVYASPRSHTLTPGTNLIPYCWVGGAQISCHGHTDSVKAIVCSPVQTASNTPNPPHPEQSGDVATLPKPTGLPSLAIMSVGEGYRDCRSASVMQSAVEIQQQQQSGSVGLSAILGVGGAGAGLALSSSQSLHQGLNAAALSPPRSTSSSNTAAAPVGEERIHMIVWQLALSAGQ